MDEILLSVIVPVYNAERYLTDFVRRLAETEIEGMEAVLVDDGSGDGSLALCRKLEESYPWVRTFHQENAGPAAARNHGLREARGKYVAYMDSDDVLDAAVFGHTVSMLERYDGEMWISDFHRVADSGVIFDRIYQIPETAEPITDPGYLGEFLAAPECMWNVWRCIFRRDFLLDNELWFIEGVHCAEDLELMVRCFIAVERPVFFHAPYYSYRVNYGATLMQVYTLHRVEQLLEMISLAREHLIRSGKSWAGHLRGKLAREYILNLPLCCQVPKADRAAAVRCFREHKGVMEDASSLPYKAAAAYTQLLGVPFAGRTLYAMKYLRRLEREARERQELKGKK